MDATDIAASIRRRLDYRQRLNTDEKRFRELILCSRDIVHWLRLWAWTYDPRQSLAGQASQPFDPFAKQVEFLAWLKQREETQTAGVAEKSRDVGATWLCGAYSLHGWLFREGFAACFGANKVELVDKKGDPKCIFEKLRFLWQNLPSWMLPRGFRERDHDCFLKLLNPANGATITGEGGDQLGRGGRVSVYFLDEAAYVERPEVVDRALSQTTPVRIYVSTPNGSGNPFARKRFSGQYPVFRLHWRQDPRKSEAWYEEQKRLLDPVTVAQELDIDYTASVEGVTIPAAWVRAAVGLELPTGEKVTKRQQVLDVPYPVSAALDVASGHGANKNVFISRQGPVVRMPIAWSHLNTHETAHRAADETERCGAKVLHYDAPGVGEGITGTLFSSGRHLWFDFHGVNTGEPPGETLWPNGKTSKQMFLNKRAEYWWMLRRRFEKTWEHVHGVAEHPPDELISLPDCPQLIAELSLPLHFYRDNGKIKIEGKDDLRHRGIASPDYADALVLLFCPWAQFVVPAKVEPEYRKPFAPRDSSAMRRGLLGRGG